METLNALLNSFTQEEKENIAEVLQRVNIREAVEGTVDSNAEAGIEVDFIDLHAKSNAVLIVLAWELSQS